VPRWGDDFVVIPHVVDVRSLGAYRRLRSELEALRDDLGTRVGLSARGDVHVRLDVDRAGH
jgi:hypothetical protein